MHRLDIALVMVAVLIVLYIAQGFVLPDWSSVESDTGRRHMLTLNIKSGFTPARGVRPCEELLVSPWWLRSIWLLISARTLIGNTHSGE